MHAITPVPFPKETGRFSTLFCRCSTLHGRKLQMRARSPTQNASATESYRMPNAVFAYWSLDHFGSLTSSSVSAALLRPFRGTRTAYLGCDPRGDREKLDR